MTTGLMIGRERIQRPGAATSADGLGSRWRTAGIAALLGWALIVAGVVRDARAGMGFSAPAVLNSTANSDGGASDTNPDIAYGSGKWICVWASKAPSPAHGSDYDIFYSYSTNNGATWSPAALLWDSPGEDYNPRIATDRQGTWVVVSSTVDTTHGDRDIQVVRSTNNGANWSAATWLNGDWAADGSSIDGEPQIATDLQGHWMNVWYAAGKNVGGSTGTDHDIFFSTSSDGGLSWGSVRVVNADALADSATDYSPSVAATGADTFAVVWSSNRGGADFEIYDSIYHYSSGSWSTPVVVNSDASTDIGMDRVPVVTSERRGYDICIVGRGCTWVPTSMGVAWEAYSSPIRDIEQTRYECAEAQFPCRSFRWAATSWIHNDSAPYYSPHLLADGQGHWVLAWNGEVAAGDNDLFMRYSLDAGVSWAGGVIQTNAASESAQDGNVRLATNSAGTWVAVWHSMQNLGGSGGDYEILTARVNPPYVTGIYRYSINPSNAASVSFLVVFSENVSGVDATDFSLDVTGAISGAAVTSISGGPSQYTVRVSGYDPTKEGTIKLNVVDKDSILDGDSNPLGGLGAGNGNYTAGSTYTIDFPPAAIGSVPSGMNPTSASSVAFTVTFSQAVTGVDVSDFSVGLTGSLNSPTVASVTDSGTSYSVQVNFSATGSGTVKLNVLDNDDSIRDAVGHPLGGWGTGNGVYSAGSAYTVDRTPPDISQAWVESTTGPYTISNTQLIFRWGGFSEDPSPCAIAKYQVALSTDGTNPPTSGAFTDALDEHGASSPNVTQHTFNGSFATGTTYYCWVRAANNVGLISAALADDVTVDTRMIPFGGDIVAFEGKTWTDVNWDATVLPGTKHAIRISQAERLVTGQEGSFSITWAFNNGPGYQRTYATSSEPAWEPRRLYHTHASDGSATGMPLVNLASVDQAILHYNSKIMPGSLGPPVEPGVWVDGTGKLQAIGDEGLVLLEYDDFDTGFIGLEIVKVLPVRPDGETDAFIGGRLLPAGAIPTPAPTPLVRRGDVDKPEDPKYIYQHSLGPQAGQLWAVRKNDTAFNMEVIWRRYGLANIVWPCELRRYRAAWPLSQPSRYQLFVRGSSPTDLGPGATIPAALKAEIVRSAEEFDNPLHHAYLEGGVFRTDGTGWTLLKYQTDPNPGQQEWVGFEVVRSVLHHDPTYFNPSPLSRSIGDEIMDGSHAGTSPGHIHVSEGNRYAPGVYGDTGQIFPVNTGALEVWWANLSRQDDPDGASYPRWPAQRVQWFSRVVRYEASWPETTALCDPLNDEAEACRMIIARQNGSGVIPAATYGTEWSIYYQNVHAQPGFNPNDEHALAVDGKVYALRDDLGTPETSLPHVLLQYRRPADGRWDFRVMKVVREEAPYVLGNWAGIDRPADPYEKVAGGALPDPMPLETFYLNPENRCPASGVASGSDHVFKDRKGGHWARSGGHDGGTAPFTMRYHYPVQPGFYFPGGSIPAVGTCVPWLAGGSGTPADVTYTVSWPAVVPTMKVGMTLMGATSGLPSIDGQCSVDILYQQSEHTGSGSSVMLVDPVQARGVPLVSLPGDIEKDVRGTETYFPKLSLALRMRVYYHQTSGQLRFKGVQVNSSTVLLNVMSARDSEEIKDLSTDPAWKAAVDNLGIVAGSPIQIHDSSVDPYEMLALTSGFAQGAGFVTLAMQNASTCGNLPISLEILKVVPDLDPGTIMVITPECPFDETLTLRHSGDFGGRSGDYTFEWVSWPSGGSDPPADPGAWQHFFPAPVAGQVEITIRGANIMTLSDNDFRVRYQYTGAEPRPWSGMWSAWTAPQLAEGWIKRVMGDIDPFTQKATGGGIQGAENTFFSYKDRTVNTVVDMISQAGPPWAGSVPLNCLNLDGFGLIETYQTVLNRGVTLSIDAGITYIPANQSLLLAASRIADLEMLLGNEAYADAADPTIAFGTDDGQYGSEASSLHSFMNQTPSLLEEELALLRGRDDSAEPGVQNYPVFNRLYWNFTRDITGGEVAYALNYNMVDANGDAAGTINEADAKLNYPQGHGDAWGHYLTAMKTYYKLLRHPNYTWEARGEGTSIIVDVGSTREISVDYLDERKFAQAAAAKARTGAEIVNLTYRQSYVEDPRGQWQGYKDADPGRAWGLAEWAGRAGTGAYFDWVVGNAVLPPESAKTGVEKIDRTTVLELRDVAAQAREIQTQADTADLGLNPLGLAANVVPFDIDPQKIDAGSTHFEQIYDRAVVAMNNAITVFNHANNSTQLLRRQADNTVQFRQAVDDREADFRNRLIEILGYPYSDECGPGKPYPSGYCETEPDVHHYSAVDPSALLGVDPPRVVEYPVRLKTLRVGADGSLSETAEEVVFHVDTGSGRFGEVKDPSWTGQRKAPGEIQMARSDLLQSRARFERALAEYDILLASIDDQAALLAAQSDLNADEISILNEQQGEMERLNDDIRRSRDQQMQWRLAARSNSMLANAIAEAIPTCVGLSTDVGAPLRSGIMLAGNIVSEIMNREADKESLAEFDHQAAQGNLQALTNIRLTTLRQDVAIRQQISQLEQTVRQEISLSYEIFALQEAMQQAGGRYLAALTRGERLIEERNRFRRQTASEVQTRRYKDMAFRIFRNDALQKYRAQYDLAARYVYLAAKAYDYETTFLSRDSRAGQGFLTDIVRERLIGNIPGGLPMTGKGLADPMARMSQNFSVLKGQLGFNNPQRETNRFSLRSELLRVMPGTVGKAVWRESLWQHVVPNILDLPEFQQYFRIFTPHLAVEPGIVIPFETNVNFGLNFFGWPAVGGDSAYDSTNFTTKVRSVGVWFSNYNNLLGSGMLSTPRVYLVPVGNDIQRSPTGFSAEPRAFKVLDQRLPEPFPLNVASLGDRSWIPIMDSLDSIFADVRRYSSFRAYHDSGQFSESEVARDSRLIGRSVWNTRWLLVIPAGTLHSDRNEGLKRFIDGMLVGGQRDGNGVSDIKIFFETYAYSGN